MTSHPKCQIVINFIKQNISSESKSTLGRKELNLNTAYYLLNHVFNVHVQGPRVWYYWKI